MKKKLIFFTGGLAAAALSLVVMTYFGSVNISIGETTKILLYKLFGLFASEAEGFGTKITIIWIVRFPRTLLAFLTGGALSVCGGVYQAVFKNPMADPFVLGVSSGAAFGATIGIVLKVPGNYLGLNMTSWFAFFGSVTAIYFVYNISRVGRQSQLTSLLLTGTAMSQLLSAVISVMMLMSSSDMKSIYFWTLGSFNGRGWSHIAAVLPYIIAGAAVVLVYSRDLDIIMLGDETAVRYGVETEKVKQRMFITTALMMSACVSVSGIIGFVGLIAPHVVRLFSGPIHKRLLPFSFLLGGIVLSLCDTIARSARTAELPVGIVTAILGAPFFIYLLRARRTEVM